MRWPWVAILACLPGVAAAQELTFSPRAVEACLEIADSPRDCIGLSAQRCMEETPGGHSTVGMGGCLDRELSYWDDRLNTAYGAVMAQSRTQDAEMEQAGRPASGQAEALRDMQRAWITFRDAACAYEYSTWGGGTGAGPAGAACLMRLTGEQALALEARLPRG